MAALRTEPCRDSRAVQLAVAWKAMTLGLSFAEVSRRARVWHPMATQITNLANWVLVVLHPPFAWDGSQPWPMPARFVQLVHRAYPEDDVEVWAALRLAGEEPDE